MSQPTEKNNGDLLGTFVDKLEVQPEIKININFGSPLIKNPLTLPKPTSIANSISNMSNSKPSSTRSFNMNGFAARHSVVSA